MSWSKSTKKCKKYRKEQIRMLPDLSVQRKTTNEPQLKNNRLGFCISIYDNCPAESFWPYSGALEYCGIDTEMPLKALFDTKKIIVAFRTK